MYLFFVVHLYKVVLIIQNTLVDSYVKKFLWPKFDTYWLNGIICTKICKCCTIRGQFVENYIALLMRNKDKDIRSQCYFHLKYVKQKLNRGFSPHSWI